MSNQPNKTNGAKPAVRKKKNLLDDRRVRLALSVLGAIVAWMVVTIIVQPGTTNTIYNVPVDHYHTRDLTHQGQILQALMSSTVFSDRNSCMGSSDLYIQMRISDGVANLLIVTSGCKHCKRTDKRNFPTGR